MVADIRGNITLADLTAELGISAALFWKLKARNLFVHLNCFSYTRKITFSEQEADVVRVVILFRQAGISIPELEELMKLEGKIIQLLRVFENKPPTKEKCFKFATIFFPKDVAIYYSEKSWTFLGKKKQEKVLPLIKEYLKMRNLLFRKTSTMRNIYGWSANVLRDDNITNIDGFNNLTRMRLAEKDFELLDSAEKDKTIKQNWENLKSVNKILKKTNKI